jgi:hypothetical protein
MRDTAGTKKVEIVHEERFSTKKSKTYMHARMNIHEECNGCFVNRTIYTSKKLLPK